MHHYDTLWNLKFSISAKIAGSNDHEYVKHGGNMFVSYRENFDSALCAYDDLLWLIDLELVISDIHSVALRWSWSACPPAHHTNLSG